MKKLICLSFLVTICLGIMGCQETDNADQEGISFIENAEGEKPIQHLKLPDIISREEAVKVMESTTAQLKSKKKLDAIELHEVHMITYSLEKAIAYFVENFSGEQQAAAKEMAEVVEQVHLNSENNRAEETKKALDQYYQLEEAFSNGL